MLYRSVSWPQCPESLHIVQDTQRASGKKGGHERTECYCTGQVIRVFWDKTLLVEGQHGFVRAFEPDELVTIGGA